EKGIELSLEEVDILAGQSRTPEFLAKNSSGGVPVLELDDGSHLSESVAICAQQRYWRPTVMARTPVPCSVIAPAIAPTDHSAGMADGGPGHADTTNSGPTRTASQANLRDHAVRLRKRRRRYCVRRSCDGYDKASSNNQPDHSYPPFLRWAF